MKRRLVSLAIVMLICLSLAGNTLALSNDVALVQPKSAVGVTCGLTKSGSQYKAWSRTEVSLSTNLTASVYLYQVVGGSEVLITSASNSGSGTSLTASKTRTLASGTYVVRGSGTAGSSSGSDSCTVVVP